MTDIQLHSRNNDKESSQSDRSAGLAFRTEIQLHSRSSEEGASQSDRSACLAFRSTKARAMLVVAALLSLGLWAAIWLALSSLALAWSLTAGTGVGQASRLSQSSVRSHETFRVTPQFSVWGRHWSTLIAAVNREEV